MAAKIKTNLKRLPWPIFGVFLVLGGLVAIQMKTRWALQRASLPLNARIEVVQAMYLNAQEEIERLRKEIASLRTKIEEQERAMAQGEDYLESLQKSLEQMKVIAGLTPVEGPGVIVRLADSQRPVILEQDQNPLVVHDLDIVQVLNELKAAGAEAITVNGQRIVAMSAVRCSGPVMQVNQVSIPSPYEIKAIGDPDTLASALELRGGLVDQLRSVGIEVRISRENKIHLPALSRTPAFRYAVPVSEENHLAARPPEE